MKKIYFLIILLLFMPLGVNALEADYTVDGLYINADVTTDGDMLVKEQIVLTGDFNGYIRDLYYKGNYTLYDASNITIKRVCDLSKNKMGIFDNIDPSLRCFKEDRYAVSGNSYLYQKIMGNDYISLKMFNYTDGGTKIFYIEYLLSDVVVVHNDVAELYWTFIGKNFDDDIEDVKIVINLPGKSTDLKAWAHGPLNGNISLKNDDTIVATVNNLYANNLVDIRSTFNKGLISNPSKTKDDNALNSILSEEQQRADEANRERERAKTIILIINIISSMWILSAIVLAIMAYLKYDKERKANFSLEYHRELPALYGPETVEFLMNKNVTTLSLSATILNIIRKKGFELKEIEDKNIFSKRDYVLKKKDTVKEALTDLEIYIRDWLIDDIGDGKEVSLGKIKDASKSLTGAKDFMKNYNGWLSLAKAEGEKEGFFENNTSFKIKSVLYGSLGFFIFIIAAMITDDVTPFTILSFVLSIFLIIYFISITKKTVKGIEDYSKWKAFKKFLLDFGRFSEKELPEIVLWEKYLVYATVFGIAEKVAKAMEVKIRDINDPNFDTTFYHGLYFNHYFTSNLVSSINTARTASMGTIASSQASSGSGMGGGFSSGGGFGGGGIGGGGRGF